MARTLEEQKIQQRIVSKSHYERNKEACREYSRIYYQKNCKKRKAQQGIWYAANKGRVAECNRKWRLTHRTQKNETKRRWRRESGSLPSESARRRANLHLSQVEKFSRQEIFIRDEGRCYLCKQYVNPSSWHLEHKIPLSRGGSHTRQNVGVSCPSCNLRKGTKIIAEAC